MARSRVIDAVKGLALLALVLAEVLPPAILPDWMYPAYLFGLRGIHVPDLILPLLLFGLGASIPASLLAKLPDSEMGDRDWITRWADVIWTISRRTLMLLVLAFLIGTMLVGPNQYRDARLFVGFFGIVLVFLRAEAKPVQVALRLAGLAVVSLLLLQQASFSFDVYAVLVALLYPLVCVVWLGLRNSPSGMVGVLGLLIAFAAGASAPGFLSEFLHQRIGPFGDLVWLLWLPVPVCGLWFGQHALQQEEGDRWVHGLSALQSALGILLVLVGLYYRVLPLTVLLALLLAANALWTSRELTSLRLSHRIAWGATLAGLVLVPLAGGPNSQLLTPSYVLITAGLTGVIALFVLHMSNLLRVTRPLEVSASAQKSLSKHWIMRERESGGLLPEVGRNAILTYALVRLILEPSLRLSGFSTWRADFGAWEQLGLSLLVVVVVGLLVSLANKLRVHCRS